MSPWITSDVIKALQARVALYMGDYKEALRRSEEIINSKRYMLVNSKEYLQGFWMYDKHGPAAEAIWVITMTVDYLGLATGSYYLANTGSNMAFIPTQGTISLFDETDIRKSVYFSDRTVKVSGTGNTTIKAFAKYPGNPYLYYQTNINNFVNMPKPFRIAEQYLIAAEAAAMLGNNTKANSHLNSLRGSRNPNSASFPSLVGDALMQAIKLERHKELLGEGFRMSDLKRWKEGFKRSPAQNYSIINQNADVHLLSYPADDHRLVWPIPQGEIDVNPQIKNQQNPYY